MKRNNKLKLTNLLKRILKEEIGTVSAKPIVKKGERVKVRNHYDGKLYTLTAYEPSEYNDEIETYGFLASETVVGKNDFGKYGIYVTWEAPGPNQAGYWCIDHAYNILNK